MVGGGDSCHRPSQLLPDIPFWVPKAWRKGPAFGRRGRLGGQALGNWGPKPTGCLPQQQACCPASTPRKRGSCFQIPRRQWGESVVFLRGWKVLTLIFLTLIKLWKLHSRCSTFVMGSLGRTRSQSLEIQMGLSSPSRVPLMRCAQGGWGPGCGAAFPSSLRRPACRAQSSGPAGSQQCLPACWGQDHLCALSGLEKTLVLWRLERWVPKVTL